jgi:hypothetical protein
MRMFKIKNIMIVALFSMFFFFNSQAQVEDTTYQETPTGTEFESPEIQTGTEMPNQQTQMDTTGKYAAHFRLAEEMTQRISETITISEEQKNDITERIIEFQEELADINMDMKEEGINSDTREDLDEELVSLVDDIEGMLDDSQRAEWIRSKNEWMNEVKAHIHSDRDVMRQNRQNIE